MDKEQRINVKAVRVSSILTITKYSPLAHSVQIQDGLIVIPRQCKGRTTEFGSVGRGSIPLRGN